MPPAVELDPAEFANPDNPAVVVPVFCGYVDAAAVLVDVWFDKYDCHAAGSIFACFKAAATAVGSFTLIPLV